MNRQLTDKEVFKMVEYIGKHFNGKQEDFSDYIQLSAKSTISKWKYSRKISDRFYKRLMYALERKPTPTRMGRFINAEPPTRPQQDNQPLLDFPPPEKKEVDYLNKEYVETLFKADVGLDDATLHQIAWQASMLSLLVVNNLRTRDPDVAINQ